MQFLFEYGLFLAKTVTVVAAALVIVGGIAAAAARTKGQRPHERLKVTRLNERYRELQSSIERSLLERKARRRHEKVWARQHKAWDPQRRRVYVLDFHGDLRASQVEALRQEVSAILMVARPEDEVLVRLESGGGLVPHYGLGASELARLRGRVGRLTVSIDRIAASGGYLMACVADRILCAPFALIGSIGVVAQLPNFHRLLKKHDVDYEMITAGRYKRTLTLFGENTEEAREKFRQELGDIHALFKDFVSRHRPDLDIERVATGEFWLGERALELKLVDAVQTSDDYLMQAAAEAELLELSFRRRRSLGQRLAAGVDSLLLRWRGA